MLRWILLMVLFALLAVQREQVVKLLPDGYRDLDQLENTGKLHAVSTAVWVLETVVKPLVETDQNCFSEQTDRLRFLSFTKEACGESIENHRKTLAEVMKKYETMQATFLDIKQKQQAMEKMARAHGLP